MAGTKAAKKPTDTQKEILGCLTSARVVRVNTVIKGDKEKVTVAITTRKGKVVDTGDLKVNKKTVESLVKAGWLVEGPGGNAGSDGETATSNVYYEITDEGKAARKAK